MALLRSGEFPPKALAEGSKQKASKGTDCAHHKKHCSHVFDRFEHVASIGNKEVVESEEYLERNFKQLVRSQLLSGEKTFRGSAAKA